MLARMKTFLKYLWKDKSLHQFTEVQWPLWSLSFPFSPPVSLPLNLHIYVGGNVVSLKN